MRKRLLTLASVIALSATALNCANLSGAEISGVGGGGADSGAGSGPEGGAFGAGGGGSLAENGDQATGGGPNDSVSAGTGVGGAGGGPPLGANACGGEEVLADLSLAITMPTSRAMSSASQARAIQSAQKKAPDPTSIRVSEFLSYYRIDFGAKKGTLNVVPALVPGPLPTQYTLQVGVQSPAPESPRRPMSITVVLDTSSSMAGASMSRAQSALAAITASVQLDDAFNLVTTNPNGPKIQRVAAADGDPSILTAVAEIGVDGGDDLGNAVTDAYGLAAMSYKAGGINRVVVITDGGALPTTLDLDLISTKANDDGINLVGVGVGPELGYKDTLLGAATAAGRGANLFIDSAAEADLMLHQRFDEVIDVAATDVLLTVTAPGQYELEEKSEGFVSSTDQLAFGDLGPGRSMVFRQMLHACNAAAVHPTDVIKIGVRWNALDGSVQNIDLAPTVAELLAASPFEVQKASAIVAYAEALKSLNTSRLNAAYLLVKQASFDSQGLDPDLPGIKATIEQNPLFTAQ